MPVACVIKAQLPGFGCSAGTGHRITTQTTEQLSGQGVIPIGRSPGPCRHAAAGCLDPIEEILLDDLRDGVFLNVVFRYECSDVPLIVQQRAE